MSKWKKVKLGECIKQIRGVSYKPEDAINMPTEGYYPILRANNIKDNALIFDDFIYVKEIKIKKEQMIQKGDIIVCASSGSKKLVGKAAQAKKDLQMSFGAFCKGVRAKNILPEYLGNYFKSPIYRKTISKLSAGASINNIKSEHLDNLEIPLPGMEEQRKIAARLDAVSDLLAKQKQLLAEQDTLIQSLFYDMFGDPIKNNKGWKIEKLGNIGSFKNGVNFRSDEDSYKIRCLGVAEFKDLTEIKDISLLPFISVNNELSNDMLLKDGDIVFVRSNGNKNLVGRSVAVYPGETPATFSGFCIRFRKNTDNFKTLYAIYFFKNKSVKERIRGRGANIQNLNQQILANLSVPVPPLELQEKFAAIVEQIESEKSKIKSAIAETQTLFNALMAEYFEE